MSEEEDELAEAKPTHIPKTEADFLYPKMPGPFRAFVIRKKPISWLKDRYIQVLSATMGNHSMAMFYCCWDQAQFDAVVDDEFVERIARARAELADRATFIMLRGVGLVDGGEGGKNQPAVTAVMARVVEKLMEKGEKDSPGNGRKGFRLVVDGLDRGTPAPAPPVRDEFA